MSTCLLYTSSDFCIGKIAEAVDGCQAMEILLHDTYDIVITDIRMPRMDGLMLCRSIREQKMHPAIAILSGYDDFKYAQTAIPVSYTHLDVYKRQVPARAQR